MPIVNRMVQYQTLDRTLSALSDPTRRDILARLGRGHASVSELATPLGMSLTGMKKHIRILEEADFVTTEKVGRTRHCRLGPGQLKELDAWLESYRQALTERYDRLDDYLQELQDQGKKEDQK